MTGIGEVRKLRIAVTELAIIQGVLGRDHWRAALDRKTYEPFGRGRLE